MDAHGRQSQLPGVEILSGFRQTSESTSPLKRFTTEYGGPESYLLVRGVNKSVVVHEIGRLHERGENYLRMRITTLKITYEIKGLTVATPRNRRPLLQGSHRQCLGPLIWESVGEPRYSLNASDEAPLCFWVSRITIANRSPDRISGKA